MFFLNFIRLNKSVYFKAIMKMQTKLCCQTCFRKTGIHWDPIFTPDVGCRVQVILPTPPFKRGEVLCIVFSLQVLIPLLHRF